MNASKPRIALIVAMDANNIIGRDGDLPWRLPADLRHFKRMTLGKPVIMGRKTWESIGRALPERPNIVVTSNQNFEAPGATVVHSLDQAVAACGEAPEIMIIGGAAIYESFLGRADVLYVTRVHAEVAGDTVFPGIGDEWTETAREDHEADAKNEYDFSFLTLERSH